MSSDFINPFIHIGALFRSSNQIGLGIFADRNVGKVPGIETAPCNHIVYKFIGSNAFCIIAMVASGITEK